MSSNTILVEKKVRLSLEQQLEALHINLQANTLEEIKNAVALIITAESLSQTAISALIGLFKVGPLDDGDIPVKEGMGELLKTKFVAVVVVEGHSGFHACTQKGYWALKVLGYPVKNY